MRETGIRDAFFWRSSLKLPKIQNKRMSHIKEIAKEKVRKDWSKQVKWKRREYDLRKKNGFPLET